MIIIRRFRKLDWFDLLDRIQKDLDEKPDKKIYFEFLDEFRMRLLDSISEGASFKLKAPTKEILMKFETRMKEDTEFATEADMQEFKELALEIL